MNKTTHSDSKYDIIFHVAKADSLRENEMSQNLSKTSRPLGGFIWFYQWIRHMCTR